MSNMRQVNKAAAVAIEALNAIESGDPEHSHSTADDILLTFFVEAGLVEVGKAYGAVVSREGAWWYA